MDVTKECSSEAASDIIADHRDRLGIDCDSGMDDKWLQYAQARKQRRNKKLKMPAPDGMCDQFAEKEGLKTLGYFYYLLSILERVDYSRRFNLLPMWKQQHRHAFLDNKILLRLLRR